MNAGGGSARVWIDGGLVDASEATVPFDDHGLTVGDGVFETIKLASGSLFALDLHLSRLRASAASVGLTCPDDDELLAAVDAVRRSSGADGFIRITLTGGRGPLGSLRAGHDGPRLIVARRDGSIRTEPTAVAISPFTRNERGALAGVKSTSYAENIVALAGALDVGATEALLANTVGHLCEGTGSNVFVGFGSRLVTPPLTAGCLSGVTRALLLELVDIAEVDIPIESLADADEMFLASTSREVQPVSSIDGRPLPHCPGPLTVAAGEAWRAAYG